MKGFLLNSNLMADPRVYVLTHMQFRILLSLASISVAMETPGIVSDPVADMLRIRMRVNRKQWQVVIGVLAHFNLIRQEDGAIVFTAPDLIRFDTEDDINGGND